MINKTIGYVSFVAGIAGVALSYSSVQTLLNIKLPESFNSLYLMIVGAVLLFVGAYLAFKPKRTIKQGMEVPIYHGKNIVGYRRH